MKNGFFSPLRGLRLFPLASKCVAVLLCYLLSAWVTGPVHAGSRWMGAMLAITAALVVIQEPDLRVSIRKGWMRLTGTFVGAMLAGLYLSFFPFSVFGLVAMVALLDIVCPLLRIPDKGQMASVTLVIILLISQAHPDLSPVENGALRFVESAVGAGVGVAAVWVNARYDMRRRTRG